MEEKGLKDIPRQIRDIAERSARKDIRHQRILAAILIIAGLTGVLLVESAIARVAGFAAIVGGLVWLLRTWIKSRDVPELIQALDEGWDIVWIYSATLEMMPFGVYLFRRQRVYLNSADAREIAIHVRERETGALLSYLRMAFPLATFGYSDEKKALFRKNPALLRKTQVDD